MRKIAVMLPFGYRGGSLRGAKNIAKSILYAVKTNDLDFQVVFSYVKGTGYDRYSDFSDLVEAGIVLRETEWIVVPASYKNQLPKGILRKEHFHYPEYCIPKDGANDFFDCDLWVIVSDRVPAPILPVKPYFLIVYDYLQRYFPEMIFWPYHESVCVPVAKEASRVFVTTPSTKNDLVSFMGVNPSKVSLLNLDFTPPITGDKDIKNNLPKNYFLWTTNLSVHKNHIRAINGIERYFEESSFEIDLVVVGVNTQYLDPDIEFPSNDPLVNLPQVKYVRNKLSQNQALKERVFIKGYASDHTYANILRNTAFLFHPACNDNGSFSVIEAAYLDVPSISSRYPAMEHINKLYSLNIHWFNPYDELDIKNQLIHFSSVFSKTKLPSQKKLLALDWHSNSQILLDYIHRYIPR